MNTFQFSQQIPYHLRRIELNCILKENSNAVALFLIGYSPLLQFCCLYVGVPLPCYMIHFAFGFHVIYGVLLSVHRPLYNFNYFKYIESRADDCHFGWHRFAAAIAYTSTQHIPLKRFDANSRPNKWILFECRIMIRLVYWKRLIMEREYSFRLNYTIGGINAIYKVGCRAVDVLFCCLFAKLTTVYYII